MKTARADPMRAFASRSDPIRRTLSDIASFHASALLRQETSTIHGWGQALGAAAKLLSVLLWLIAVSFIRRPEVLLAAAVLPAVLAATCRVPLREYLVRTWMFVPLFTGLIALPAAFSIVTPGHPLIRMWNNVSLTREGLLLILSLVLRVGASVSWVLWLLSVTGWHRLARGLRDLGLSRLPVFLLTMTVRFLTVQMETVSEMHFGRLSRPAFRMSRRSQWRWTADRVADLVRRTRLLAETIDEGLRSRGWEGDPLVEAGRRFRPRDYLWILSSALAAACAIWLGR